MPDDCLVNFVSFSLCFCLIICDLHWCALPCSRQQCSFLFFDFDDFFYLISFQAIVSCHVICIVCHAIRSMSLIFGRIYLYACRLHGILMIEDLRADLRVAACFLLSAGDSWRACFRPWLLSSSLVVNWLLSSLLFDISLGQALSNPFVLLMIELFDLSQMRPGVCQPIVGRPR